MQILSGSILLGDILIKRNNLKITFYAVVGVITKDKVFAAKPIFPAASFRAILLPRFVPSQNDFTPLLVLSPTAASFYQQNLFSQFYLSLFACPKSNQKRQRRVITPTRRTALI
ncbi:MAG: hypothetical protein JSR00_09025 [Bacteroidetes bacterium]|nr:hypothetical protein [Bacteroidota bacterium]